MKRSSVPAVENRVSPLRLRHKLILVFLAATLVPLGAILWMSASLLRRSLDYAATEDLDRLSKSLEGIAREYYRQARDQLKADAAAGKLEARVFTPAAGSDWPAFVEQFGESREQERFFLSEPDGDRLNYLVRRGPEVRLYTRTLNGVRMEDITRQYREARDRIERVRGRDLRRGFTYTLIVLSAAVWLVALGGVVYLARRISGPIQELTAGLLQLAGGDFAVRLEARGRDEVGRAVEAFNHTAAHLEESRDRLLYLTRIASWQSLARKMAHELKNSLTPIRLTVEEILAREPNAGRPFLQQAARVVIAEVESLERRVRAFSEFAADPPVRPEALDINALARERIRLLQAAHTETAYEVDLGANLPAAWADADQVRGILTNLMENAAEAAGAGGRVLVVTAAGDGGIAVEVHDSGPGLSPEARGSLFEPSISFKKNGMGLGLSIARKNALLAGGDLREIPGRLPGAAFRLLLPQAPASGAR